MLPLSSKNNLFIKNEFSFLLWTFFLDDFRRLHISVSVATKNLPVVQPVVYELYNWSCSGCTTGNPFIVKRKKEERMGIKKGYQTTLIPFPYVLKNNFLMLLRGLRKNRHECRFR